MNNNETKMGDVRVKAIIESLLFVNERPIELNELIQITEAGKKDIELAIEELISEYATRNSGICIVKIAGGYQMCSCPDNETWVKKMYQERSKQKLSMAALETLAIAAYTQPITRIEIEAIRGVNVDGVVRKLDELGLIKIGGRKDVVGKPFLYITTRKFLEYFGINSLKDLPKLEDFAALIGKEGLDKPVQDSSSAVDEAAGGCIEGSTENKGEPS
jgi:segregation and condensation protein B